MRKSIKKYIDKKINLNNFNNKNIFITGGNSGIGFELAKQCAYLGANLFLLCRNANKANIAKEIILKEYPDTKIEIIRLDLADFHSIRECISTTMKLDIDIFVNNAGVYHLPKSYTKDGFEITMGTNFIGTLYLNDLLMPILAKQNHESKVLFETSITAKMERINYDDFFMDKKYSLIKIYGRSKCAINNIYFNYLDELKDTNTIKLYLSHPGVTYTPLIKKAYKSSIFHRLALTFMTTFFHSVEKASLTMLYALNNENNSIVGPRNLFEISGLPKRVRFKKDKRYKYCVELGRKLIKQAE